jgi:NDP-sugar pyrophosphorylase family protein
MKAMIFAAGLGTRLRPHTNDKPKAMVPINGMPLLEIAIRRLKKFGFRQIIVNVHHFAHLIEDFIDTNNAFGIDITISDERELLLETGGGLKKAAAFFGNEPFLVCNTDILNDLDLKAFYDFHQQSNAIATLAVRNRSTSRYLIFNHEKHLVGWRNIKTGEEKWSRTADKHEDWAFSGIHVIDPKIFAFMPDKAVFSIIDVYLKAAQTEIIQAFPHNNSIWLDVGKPHALEEATQLLPQIEMD